MTTFLLLYYALLVLWMPLLWSALRLRGWKRAWLFAVAGAGLLAMANEVWQTVWAVNAIRLDILLFSVVLSLLYATAAGVLYGAHRRRGAMLLGGALVLIGGGMIYEWMLVVREGQRLTVAFDDRNALLFRAKFRDQATYERYYGPFPPDTDLKPSGHWQAQGPAYFTRLIVNGEGRAWLFYRCGETECAFSPTEPGLQRRVDAARGVISWQAVLRPVIGDALPVEIVRDSAGGLQVEARGQVVAFAKAPPPIDAEPAPKSLEFLGGFTAVACLRAHAKIRQIWLWREGARLYAVGVFQTLLAGQRARFVTPAVLGEGRKDGGVWTFEMPQDRLHTTVSVALTGNGAGNGREGSVSLTLRQDGQPPETLDLERKSVFRDEAIDFAPLTAKADWDRWFASVLVGSFFSADIPACK